jgi:putative transposase
MRRVNSIISRAQWQQDTVASVVSTFQLSDFGRSLSAALLGRLIVMAACVGTSLSGAARRTRRSPSGETVRKALLANLPEDLSEMERRINDSLLRLTPKAFLRRPRRLAIDLHQRPYYGERENVPVRGGKKKKGTKWFWTWATAAVVEHGQRWTVAMTPVGPGDPLEDVLARLLEHVKMAAIAVKMALVDREFYAAKVIAVLQSRGIPFLMPAIRRGQLKGPNGPTGTRRFFQPGTTGFFQHTWTARGKSNGQQVTVRIACVPRRADDRRKGPLVFAFRGLSSGQLEWYREKYRRRFGIETSYRQLGEGLAQTTTKRIAWRMLLVAVALLLRNLWVWRNQHVHHGPVSLSIQLHQLNIYLSRELELTLDFEIAKT